jgi:hypothetical protein
MVTFTKVRRFELPEEIVVEVNGQQFVGHPITTDQADRIFSAAGDDKRRIASMLACASFNIAEEDLAAMPMAVRSKLIETQTELNELKRIETAQTGEVSAAAS